MKSHHLRVLLSLTLSIAVAATASTVFAATLHTDDFESGVLDWSSGAQLSRLEDGGPAGAGDAFLSVTSTNHLAAHNDSSIWTGDLTAVNATHVTADLMVPEGEPALQIRLVLFGSGFLSAADRWVSVTAGNVPADGVWRTYEFSLSEDNLARKIGSGSYATLMSGVQRLMLRHGPEQAGGAFVQGQLGIDNVTLVTTAEVLAGDYNDDGLVNIADYTAWRNNLGAPAGTLANDIDGGTIGAAQYLTWKSEFGSSQPGTISTQVPEPAGAACLVAGALALIGLTNWRSRVESSFLISSFPPLFSKFDVRSPKLLRTTTCLGYNLER